MDIKYFFSTLKSLIALKSVSSDINCKDQILKSAEWLKNYFITNGYSSKLYQLAEANPLVFAESKVSDMAKTVLIYGHYDVAAADDQSGWISDPFTLTERENKLYARGIADDKGQFFIHLSAISKLITEKNLKVNVKIILEGNEEVENPHFEDFIKTHKQLLAADLVLISDGPGVGGLPTIEASLRAGFDLTLIYKTTNTPLHIGIYGGGIPNAAHEMMLILSKLINENNEIKIPGFYNDVDIVKVNEKESCLKLVPNESVFIKSLGLKALLLKPGNSFYLQTGLQPTIQVTGFKSGHIDDGYGATVPNLAEVKIDVQLVKSQQPEKIISLIKDFIKAETPTYISYDLSISDSGIPVKVDISKPIFVKIQKLIKAAYGKEAYIRYVGGSIPVVAIFQKILNTEPLVLSLANEDSNEHGPNENLNIDIINKAFKFSYLFFSSEVF